MCPKRNSESQPYFKYQKYRYPVVLKGTIQTSCLNAYLCCTKRISSWLNVQMACFNKIALSHNSNTAAAAKNSVSQKRILVTLISNIRRYQYPVISKGTIVIIVILLQLLKIVCPKRKSRSSIFFKHQKVPISSGFERYNTNKLPCPRSDAKACPIAWGKFDSLKNTISGKFMALSKSPNRQVNIPTLIPHTKVRPRLSSLFWQKNTLHSEIVTLNCMPL